MRRKIRKKMELYTYTEHRFSLMYFFIIIIYMMIINGYNLLSWCSRISDMKEHFGSAKLIKLFGDK